VSIDESDPPVVAGIAGGVLEMVATLKGEGALVAFRKNLLDDFRAVHGVLEPELVSVVRISLRFGRALLLPRQVMRNRTHKLRMKQATFDWSMQRRLQPGASLRNIS
jgi:hypothetical protein